MRDNYYVKSPRMLQKRHKPRVHPPKSWGREVPSSNLGAPTTYFFVFNELFPILQRWKPNLGSSFWVTLIGVAPRLNLDHATPLVGHTNHFILCSGFHGDC
jgi:hypothetical protein